MKKLLNRRIIGGINLIMISVFCVVVANLNILPIHYLIAMIILLIAIYAGLYRLMNPKKNKIGWNITAKLISLILSICLLLGSKMVIEGNSFLGSLQKTYQEHKVSVIVLVDSDIETVTDLPGKNLAMNTTVGGVILANAATQIEEDAGGEIHIEETQDFNTLTDKLYNGEVDAIVINETNRSSIIEQYPTFEEDTRVVHQVEIIEEIEGASDVSVTKETFTVYLSANDFYEEDAGADGFRTDVNMLVTVNPTTKQILLTSIPRDTFVPLSFAPGYYDKLTHLANYGLNDTMDTISGFLDVEIDYYATVNFTSFTDLVDAVGGVTIDNPNEFTSGLKATDGRTTYDFAEGEIDLDGDQALAFVRERDAFLTGDNQRGLNQQLVVEGLIEKVLDPNILFKYSNILSSLEGTIETTVSDGAIKSLVQMQLNDMSGWDIYSIQVYTEPDRSTNCYSWIGQSLSISVPFDFSINEINSLITAMENNQEISEVNDEFIIEGESDDASTTE